MSTKTWQNRLEKMLNNISASLDKNATVLIFVEWTDKSASCIKFAIKQFA